MAKITTGMVRASFVHVDAPQSINGSEPKYSASLIIPKSDTVTIKKIRDAQQQAVQEGLAKFGGKPPASLKLPLRDGDAERPGDVAYANSYFVNANNREKPGLVDRFKQPLGTGEIYSGCYVRASLNFYAFNTNGNRGIACSLNHLMKVADGDALNGRSRAEDDFDDDYDYSTVPGYIGDDEEDDVLG